jgi:hypothetical protein
VKRNLFVRVCSVVCVLTLSWAIVNVVRFFISRSSERVIVDNNNASSEEGQIIDIRGMAPTNLEIIPEVIDFGTVVPDTVLEAKFSILNTGSELLYLQRLKADCICTSAETDKAFASPGDSIIVTLKLNTKDKEGNTVVYATFMANTTTVLHKIRMRAKVQEESRKAL